MTIQENQPAFDQRSSSESVLTDVPTSLSSFDRAMWIQDQSASVGFTWKERQDAWDKLQEEFEELEYEVKNHTEANPRHAQIEDEFGDVIFTLIKYARFIGVDPDKALEGANQKFIKRFQQVEQLVQADNKQFNQLSKTESEGYWLKAKAHLAGA